MGKIGIYKTRLDEYRYPVLVMEGTKYCYDARKRYNSPDIIAEFCTNELKLHLEAEEYVYAFALDGAGRLAALFEISHGSANYSITTPREVFQKLLAVNASSFVLVHNHPSGDVTPSWQDDGVTKRLKQAGDIMNVPLVDHIIIGEKCFFSYREEKGELNELCSDKVG